MIHRPSSCVATLIACFVMDDDRRYWNPGALFAERAVAYWRRPHRSRLLAAVGLTLASSVIGIVLAVAIYSWL